MGHSHGPGGYVDASRLEAAHHLGETAVFLVADEVVGGDADVVKNQLASIQTAVAHLVQISAHLETRVALLHHESTYAPVLGIRRPVGASQQAEGVPVAPIGNEHFGAVDDVLFAVLVGGGLEVGYIGASAGSVRASPPRFLPDAKSGRNRRFCSSVP